MHRIKWNGGNTRYEDAGSSILRLMLVWCRKSGASDQLYGSSSCLHFNFMFMALQYLGRHRGRSDLSRPPSGVHQGLSLARSLQFKRGFTGGQVLLDLSRTPELAESPSPIRPSSLGGRCPRGRGSSGSPMRHGRHPCSPLHAPRLSPPHCMPCPLPPPPSGVLDPPAMEACAESTKHNTSGRNGSPCCERGWNCAPFF